MFYKIVTIPTGVVTKISDDLTGIISVDSKKFNELIKRKNGDKVERVSTSIVRRHTLGD